MSHFPILNWEGNGDKRQRVAGSGTKENRSYAHAARGGPGRCELRVRENEVPPKDDAEWEVPSRRQRRQITPSQQSQAAKVAFCRRPCSHSRNAPLRAIMSAPRSFKASFRRARKCPARLHSAWKCPAALLISERNLRGG